MIIIIAPILGFFLPQARALALAGEIPQKIWKKYGKGKIILMEAF